MSSNCIDRSALTGSQCCGSSLRSVVISALGGAVFGIIFFPGVGTLLGALLGILIGGYFGAASSSPRAAI